MKQSLKFKKAIAYFDINGKPLVFQLEDGRYGMVYTELTDAPSGMLIGHIGGQKISYLRGRDTTEAISEELIQKAKKILEDEKSNIIIGS